MKMDGYESSIERHCFFHPRAPEALDGRSSTLRKAKWGECELSNTRSFLQDRKQ